MHSEVPLDSEEDVGDQDPIDIILTDWGMMNFIASLNPPNRNIQRDNGF
jgi:hypothetical protein